MDDAPWFRHYEEGVPRTIPYPEITLPEALDQTVARFPDRVALRFFLDARLPAPTLTYRQLQEQTLRFATALFQLGVRKGDRVALMLPNCPQLVVAFYGAMRIGAIPVNTNPMYVSREMREQFEDSGCETVVLLDQFYPRLREIHAATRVRRVIVVDVAETPALARARCSSASPSGARASGCRVPAETDTYSFRDLVRSYPPTPPGADLKPSDVALLQYTGGTTGTPKAAMLTHRNLVANSLQARAWFPGRGRREIFLGAIPFFHVYGLTSVLLFGIAQAAEIVVIPRPRPVDIVLEAIQRFRVTLFPGVPTLYAAINEHPRVGEYDLRSGALCVSGAAPLPREVFERFEALTGGRLVEGYGLTETSPLTHCTPLFGERRPGSIGLPFPDTEARIVDMTTRRAAGAGRGGRARGARAAGDARLLGAARGDGRGLPRRLAPHRRRGAHGPRRLLPRGGPPEGHDRRLRLQGAPARGGGGAPHAPEGPRGRGGGRARRLPRRDGEGLRGPEARRDARPRRRSSSSAGCTSRRSRCRARSSSGASCRSRWWGSTSGACWSRRSGPRK